MKTFAAAFAVLVTLCAPALADSGPPQRSAPSESFKVRFTLRDAATTRTFDVVVAAASPCATANEKLRDREVDLRACVSAGSLDVVWMSRSSSGEYRSTSSLPFAHGATAELGTASGPRLTVEVQ